MKKTISVLSFIFGVLGMLLSEIAIKVSVPLIILLSFAKVMGWTQIPWIAGVTSLGAVSTGVILLVGGITIQVISFIVSYVSAFILERS